MPKSRHKTAGGASAATSWRCWGRFHWQGGRAIEAETPGLRWKTSHRQVAAHRAMARGCGDDYQLVVLP